jgi:hypothetical protein
MNYVFRGAIRISTRGAVRSFENNFSFEDNYRNSL